MKQEDIIMDNELDGGNEGIYFRKKDYDNILSEEEHHILRQIGAQHTEGIWKVARMVSLKVEKLAGFFSKDFIYRAFAADLQKSSQTIRKWYYTYKFYGDFNLATYEGLSYSHLSWAMGYENWQEILDWCVDNSATVDRMKAEWINSQASPKGLETILEGIKSLVGRLLGINTEHAKKALWIAQLRDMADEIENELGVTEKLTGGR